MVVDVSGSVETPLPTQFAGEIESLSRRLGAALVPIVGDMRVHSAAIGMVDGARSLPGLTEPSNPASAPGRGAQ
ncbi:hypothetical protein [Piscinibacter defluvii]|uniref:hypothetical protein n=1 Tax=Piscinibacter defluvii TaxID=1796922 RepID=UPI000FDE44D9|nr:hypothetical protein [Piscinibacter defluvii]